MELGHDFTEDSRSAVDALLMECKYNRDYLKIPNSCLEGLQRRVNTVRCGSTHHLCVRHWTKAGHKYIRLDLCHVLCWERRDEEYRKGPKEGKINVKNSFHLQMFELIEQGTKRKTEIMFVLCFQIFLPTREQLGPRLKVHDAILADVTSIDGRSKYKTKKSRLALPPAVMNLMKAESGSVLR